MDCRAANINGRAATNAGSSAEAANENNQVARPPPHQTAYGLSSDGTTTDLYSELFRSKPRERQLAAVPPASAPPGAVPQGQPAPAVASNRPAQEPVAAQAEPATATVYGLSSDGTTTDLYTELFGRRNRD